MGSQGLLLALKWVWLCVLADNLRVLDVNATVLADTADEKSEQKTNGDVRAREKNTTRRQIVDTFARGCRWEWGSIS